MSTVTIELFLQQTVNAVSLGGTYALLALGLAIVFSIMGMINFAHGELMTISGYTLFYCGLAGVPFIISVPLAILVAMLAAMAMERIAFRPVRNSSPATMLVTSFAVAIILQTLFQNLISTRSQPVLLPDVLAREHRDRRLSDRRQQAARDRSRPLSCSSSSTGSLKRTAVGVAMRAAAEDFPVARLMGVRANAVISGAFALSGLLAGVAAVLWVSQRASVDPLMGFVPVLKAFIASILGGLGSLTGAVAGGFLLGFIEIYLTAFLPEPCRSSRNRSVWASSCCVAVAAERADPGGGRRDGEGMTVQDDTGKLLSAQDPVPVDVENPDSTSPVFLVCEHAGRAVPARLGDLGVSPADMERHIAWDVGAGPVARLMAARLGATLVRQNFSRLVIDCNRPLRRGKLHPAGERPDRGPRQPGSE